MTQQRTGNAYAAGALGDLAIGVNAAGNYAPLQFAASSSTWLSAQPNNADATSAALDMSDYSAAWIYATVVNTSTPVGKIQILGSVDGVTYSALNHEAKRVYGTGFTFDEEAAPTDFSFDGSVNVALMVLVEVAPPYLKIFYDRASGGTTGNKVNAGYFIRRSA